MRRAYGADDIRVAEHATGSLLTDGTLMQRAATALAVVAADLLGSVYGARVVLLVGSGGNGGDALFAGAQLARRGARVDAILLGGTTHEAGLEALRRAGARVHAADSDDALDAVAAAALVVDGIAGIGATVGLRPEALALLDEVDPAATVLAVDVPSGIDVDSGELPLGKEAVVADVTVTFGATKTGLLVDPAAEYAGQVVVADVGLESHLPAAEAEVLDTDDVAALLRRPRPSDDKYARGVVGIVAGSEAYGGAGVLCVAGAIGAGAGMVRFAGQGRAVEAVRAAHPEAVVTELTGETLLDAGRVQAWVIGPGGGTDAHAAGVLSAALASDVPVVVDADGLTLIATDPDLARLVVDREAATVLTPHAGELARLLGVGRDEVEAARIAHVRDAAGHFSATVLLKGSTTVVAPDPRRGESDRRPDDGDAPHDAIRVNPRATPWLATAGAGDVLAGIIGTLLASGLDAVDAASAGAWLHAAAAELASQGGPIRAQDIAAVVPDVVASLLEPVAEADSAV